MASRRSRRWTMAVVGIVTGLIASLLIMGPSSAKLTDSTFEANDGDLEVTSSDNTDWANVGISCTVPVGCGIDKPTGSGDDSFGNGSKEDTAVPSVVSGGIPNNKSDLTRFYIKGVAEGGDNFVYLAWERVQDPTGTTNMDFELNQRPVNIVAGVDTSLSSNGVTPRRMAGDLLIAYKLPAGSTVPAIFVHRWSETGASAATVCESANSFPCWSKGTQLDGATAEGLVNAGEVIDPIRQSLQTSDRTLSPRTFGEAAINLTDIRPAIFPSNGDCVTFGRAYAKSRSSDTFGSALKDFIAPVPATISNCGSIDVKKEDDAGQPIGGVTFTLYPDTVADGAYVPAGDIWPTETVVPTCTTVVTTVTITSHPTSVAYCGTKFTNLKLGDYWLVETVPLGYTALNLGVTPVRLDSTYRDVVKTITNSRSPGSVKLQKNDDAGNPLPGALFTLHVDAASSTATYDPAVDVATNPALTCTSSDSSSIRGVCLIENILTAGSYWVVETTPPAGYSVAPPRLVTVSLGQVTNITSVPFVDYRQYKVIVLVCQESTSRLVASDITFDDVTTSSAASTAASGSTDAICGSTGGAVFSGKTADTYTAGAVIPKP